MRRLYIGASLFKRRVFSCSFWLRSREIRETCEHPRSDLLASCIFLLILSLTGQDAAAQVTYQFTGTPYLDPVGVYTTGMRLTGTFTTAEPLPANLPLTEIGPGGDERVLDATFSDGVVTFNLADSSVLFGDPARFAVSTDADGNIDRYAIGLVRPASPHTIGQLVDTFLIRETITRVFNQGTCLNVNAGGDCSTINEPEAGTGGIVDYNLLAPAERPDTGTWVRLAPSAEATSIPLLSPLGLAGLLLFLLQRLHCAFARHAIPITEPGR